MLQAPSIMEIDAAAPATGGPQSGVDKKSETVEDYQVGDLWTITAKLYANASEVEEQAKRMLADAGPEAANEYEHAKRQADTMRSTAEQVSIELITAPKDKSGRVKISPTRLASLASSVNHVMVCGEKEKAVMTEITTEAKGRQAEIGAEMAKPKSSVFTTIRKVCGIAEHAPAVAATAVVAHGWRDEARSYLSETQHQASQAAHRIWQSASTRIGAAVTYVAESAPVRAIRHYGGMAVAGVTTFVTHPVDTTVAAYDAAVEGTADLMEAAAAKAKQAAQQARDAYEVAQKAVSERFAAAKASASRALASLNPFSGDDKPSGTAVAKTSSPASTTNMAKARIEALALSLPPSLLGLSLTHAPSIGSMPNLPGLGLNLDAFSRLF